MTCHFVRPATLSRFGLVVSGLVLIAAASTWSQQATTPDGPAAAANDAKPKPAASQAELDAAFAKMLSGATLEGSYTSTGQGRSADRVRRDKYTLGEVRKLQGNMWLIQAKIQYRDGDAVMLPLPLPVEWAGDTPVIVVDNLSIPGMGTFSARVMFFADHYAGYWKHDERGGHLFGVIQHDDQAAAPPTERTNDAPSIDKPSAGQERNN